MRHFSIHEFSTPVSLFPDFVAASLVGVVDIQSSTSQQNSAKGQQQNLIII
jgi:hypothetical protein